MNALLRTLVALGTTVATVTSGPPWWVAVAAAACGVGWAVWPSSGFGLAALAVATTAWAFADAPSTGLLLAVLAMLTAHLVAAVLAHGPRGWQPDAGLLRLWLLRGAAVWLSVPLLSVIVLGLDDVDLPGLWPWGLAVAVGLLAFGWGAFEPPGTPDAEGDLSSG